MSMIKCPNCGRENSADSAFCSFCGAKIDGQSAGAPEQRSTVLRCPNCGKEISAGDLFCGFCGAKVDQAAAGLYEEAPAGQQVVGQQTASQQASGQGMPIRQTAAVGGNGVFAVCDYLYTEEVFASYYRELGKEFNYVLPRSTADTRRLIAAEFFKKHGTDAELTDPWIFNKKSRSSSERLKRNDPRRTAPWTFHERIEIGDKGITICFGPADCSEEEFRAHSITSPWGQWRAVRNGKVVLVIICRDDMKIGPTAAAVLGNSTSRDMWLVRRATQYEDAVIPKEKLRGMTPEALEEKVRQKIKAAGS